MSGTTLQNGTYSSDAPARAPDTNNERALHSQLFQPEVANARGGQPGTSANQCPPLPQLDIENPDPEKACHARSYKSRNWFTRSRYAIAENIVWLWGWIKKQQMVAPIPRTHGKIKYTGDPFSVLVKECIEQLYDDNTRGKFGTVDFLSFNRLHHLNLHYFELELATKLANVVKKETSTQDILDLRVLLREYNIALRDYEMVLMRCKQPSKGQLTPFHRCLFPEGFQDHIRSEAGSWDNGYMPLFSANAPETALWARILAAILGAVALLIPMLVMSVNYAPLRNVVTTSVAVGVVAMVLAFSPYLAVTAGYTAVLVVFVGTSTSGQAGGNETGS